MVPTLGYAQNGNNQDQPIETVDCWTSTKSNWSGSDDLHEYGVEGYVNDDESNADGDRPILTLSQECITELSSLE